MTSFQRHAFVALLVVVASGLAIGSADAQDSRLPMLTNERGGPPIARWRVHAKGLERLPQARSAAFMAKYTAAAQFTPQEVVVLNMVVRRIDLATAARVVGMESRIGGLEQMLRREQSAGELRLTGKGSATRLVPIWPPPGYHLKKTGKQQKGE
jgi:hypothetical protein